MESSTHVKARQADRFIRQRIKKLGSAHTKPVSSMRKRYEQEAEEENSHLPIREEADGERGGDGVVKFC